MDTQVTWTRRNKDWVRWRHTNIKDTEGNLDLWFMVADYLSCEQTGDSRLASFVPTYLWKATGYATWNFTI